MQLLYEPYGNRAYKAGILKKKWKQQQQQKTYNVVSSSFNPHKPKKSILISERAWEITFIYNVSDSVEVDSKVTIDVKANRVEFGNLRHFPN